MFSTCLFCHVSLGANESIEHFPVGKRLAFDSANGRLWAVCPRCARWNLTPLEERWDALEECERAYRESRKRVSTDNIALARLRDGTDLIRIGQPLRTEFAAWRYERVINKRRWKANQAAVLGASGAVAFYLPSLFASNLALPFLPVSVGALLLTSGQIGQILWTMHDLYWRRHMSVPLEGREVARLTRGQLCGVKVTLGDDERLRLAMTHGGRRVGLRKVLVDEQKVEVVGSRAHEALRRIIVGVNHEGAAREVVGAAVRVVEATYAPAEQQLDADAIAASPLKSLMRMTSVHNPRERRSPPDGVLGNMSERHRLALEMILHEEDERRAMADELGALYARWEEAERIAKIADGELTPLPS